MRQLKKRLNPSDGPVDSWVLLKKSSRHIGTIVPAALLKDQPGCPGESSMGERARNITEGSIL
jgi:hypothetical protein